MNNQTHRRSVRERLIKYTERYKVADLVEIHVGKRQDSIRSDGDGLPWQETDCRAKSPSDSPRVSSR